MPKKKTATKKVDFQKEFAKLEKITTGFEDNSFDLETGLKKFEEGLKSPKAYNNI